MNNDQYPRRERDMPRWTAEENQRPTTALPAPDENVSFFSNTPRKQLENYFAASLFALAILFVVLTIAIFIANQPNLFNNICQTTQCFRSSVSLLDAMNSSVDPCEDFYQFACGSWKADYPADVEDEFYSLQSWTTEQSIKQKKVLIGQLRKNNSFNDPAGVRAARRVFNACQNMAAINTVGMTSLWSLLDKLGLPRHPLNTTGTLQWVSSLGRAARYLGIEPLVGMTITASDRNSSTNLITLYTPEDAGYDGIFGGWSMDNVFAEEKPPTVKISDKWETQVSKFIKYMIEADGLKVEDEKVLFGLAKSIYKVFAIVNEAVKADNYPKYLASATPKEMKVSEFQKIIDDSSSSTGASRLQIQLVLEELFGDFPELNVDFAQEKLAVYRVQYYRTLSRLMAHVTDHELQLFIWWKVIYLLAIHTNEDLIYLKDKMLRNLSDGKHRTLSRESVCYYNVIRLMKPSLGYFVMMSIDKLKLQQVETIANKLRDSLISTVKDQQWIDESTRKAIFEKARALKFFIGIPEWMKNWTNFDELYRSRGENRPGIKDGQIPLYEFKHLENLVTLIDFSVRKVIKQLRRANTGDDEDFDPTLINAYYAVSLNSVFIPYGILDLPMFGWENVALNYGSTGGFLGHELIHGFDNTGRNYDKNGNLGNFWSTKSLSQHDKRVSCFVTQYSNFQVPNYFQPMVKVDGNLTVQENMADIAGLDIAFRAYKNYMNRSPLELKMPGLQEYSQEQLFFLAFARAKCTKYSKLGLETILQDVHSPDFVRVLATLRNSPDFSKAWGCPKGSFMNPEEKCRIWS